MENHVADQIRFYRRQEGLTQEQLAEAMGLSVAAVSKWEQGQSLPEIPMLMELADFFDQMCIRDRPNHRLPEHSTMRRAKQCRIRQAVCRRGNVTRASR